MHTALSYLRLGKRFKNNVLSDVGTKVTNYKSNLEKLRVKLSSQAGIDTLTGVASIQQELAEIGADVKEVKESGTLACFQHSLDRKFTPDH